MRKTSIYELETTNELIALCKELIEKKKVAPKSLKYLIAVTEERDVIYRKTKPDNKSFPPRRAKKRRGK